MTPTDKVTIDGARALSLLARAVDDKGSDYVYEPQVREGETHAGCWYVTHGIPSCGVAQALRYEGVPTGVLEEADDREDSSIHQVTDLLANAGFRLAPAAITAFATFQLHQDQGRSWGYAFDAAKEALR